MQDLGEDLVTVLDQLRIKYCIGIGDGAGSNIIVRFGMMHVTRCLGVVLINPTTNKVTMMDNLKDRFHKWKISHIPASGEHMVTFRRFGHKVITLVRILKQQTRREGNTGSNARQPAEI